MGQFDYQHTLPVYCWLFGGGLPDDPQSSQLSIFFFECHCLILSLFFCSLRGNFRLAKVMGSGVLLITLRYFVHFGSYDFAKQRNLAVFYHIFSSGALFRGQFASTVPWSYDEPLECSGRLSGKGMLNSKPTLAFLILII